MTPIWPPRHDPHCSKYAAFDRYSQVNRWYLTLFDPFLTPGVLQERSKFKTCQKWIRPLSFSYEITRLCKFSAFVGDLSEIIHHYTSLLSSVIKISRDIHLTVSNLFLPGTQQFEVSLSCRRPFPHGHPQNMNLGKHSHFFAGY